MCRLTLTADAPLSTPDINIDSATSSTNLTANAPVSASDIDISLNAPSSIVLLSPRSFDSLPPAEVESPDRTIAIEEPALTSSTPPVPVVDALSSSAVDQPPLVFTHVCSDS